MQTRRRPGPRNSPSSGPWLPNALSRRPLSDDHARRSQQLAPEAVAGLKDLRDDVIVLGRQSRLGGERFVNRRIERLVERVNDLQTGGGQRRQELRRDE